MMRTDRPVFLVGWFRSGTTLFWSQFRASQQCRCYYEPLHEHLLSNVEGGYSHNDPTHDGVLDYWAEYRDLPLAEFRQYWRPWFGRERLVLSAHDPADDLKAYLDYLISRAQGRTPVFKFLRAGARAGWLRRHYPDAHIIQIARSPRAVWSSMMGRDAVGDDTHLQTQHAQGWMRTLSKFTHALAIPSQDHPYQEFYLLWRLLFSITGPVADETWWYEDAVQQGEPWLRERCLRLGIADLSQTVQLHTRSLDAPLHADSWFWEQELAADSPSEASTAPRVGQEDARSAALIGQLTTLEDRYQALFLSQAALLLDNARMQERLAKSGGQTHRVAIAKLVKLAIKLCRQRGV